MGDNGAGIRIAIVKGSVRSGNFTAKAVALVVDELQRLKVSGVDVIDPAELNLAFPGMPAGHSRAEDLRATIKGATGVVLASMAQGAVSREITMVAKNMVFVIESPTSTQQANPTITVKAGQRITIVLRNDDPGMQHDLVIEGLQVQLEVISSGETTRVTFTAPREPGRYVYLCSLHPRSMRGVFIVE